MNKIGNLVLGGVLCHEIPFVIVISTTQAVGLSVQLSPYTLAAGTLEVVHVFFNLGNFLLLDKIGNCVLGGVLCHEIPLCL